MKTKDEFIKYLKQTNKVMYRANNVMYRELQLRIQDKDKIIRDKDKIIRDKEKRIQELKVEVMSVKGLLHCRGLMELFLKELHFEKGIETDFNATKMCGMISFGEKGKYEKILVDAAKKVTRKYKENDLNRSSGGNPSKLYIHVYDELSSRIHEKPHYGMTVRSD